MTKSKHVVRISKLDAAERQLVEAIRLFFEDRDALCVHTLASAAEGILASLAKGKRISNPLRGSKHIRPEHQRKWNDAVGAVQEFFKSAAKATNKSFDVRPNATPFHLLACLLLYRALTNKPVPEVATFLQWFFRAHPDLLVDDEFRRTLVEKALPDAPAVDNKAAWSMVLLRLREAQDRGHPVAW